MKKTLRTKVMIAVMAFATMSVTTATIVFSSTSAPDVRAEVSAARIPVTAQVSKENNSKRSIDEDIVDANGKHPGECGYGYYSLEN